MDDFDLWEQELDDASRLAWLAIEIAIAGFDRGDDATGGQG